MRARDLQVVIYTFLRIIKNINEKNEANSFWILAFPRQIVTSEGSGLNRLSSPFQSGLLCFAGRCPLWPLKTLWEEMETPWRNSRHKRLYTLYLNPEELFIHLSIVSVEKSKNGEWIVLLVTWRSRPLSLEFCVRCFIVASRHSWNSSPVVSL